MKSDGLGEERGAATQRRAQPAADEGRVGVAHVVGRDDERTVVGQVVEAFDTDARDGAQTDAAERGDEARIGRQATRATHAPAAVAGLMRRPRARG